MFVHIEAGLAHNPLPAVHERLAKSFRRGKDGRIASLWLDRPGGNGDHELKIMTADGSDYFLALADLDLFDGLGASLQVISTKQTEDSYDPEVEWAYLKYDFDNDVSVRVGQMKVPFLQGTELRYVGHSRQWAWPVVPINGAGGFDVLRGAEIYYSTYYDDYDILLHASLGEPDHGLDFIKDTWAGLVSAELDSGAGKLRASYMQAGFDIYSEDNQLLYANTTLRMGSLEGEYEWNNWITHGGMATGTAYKHPDEYLAYFSLGYRFDRLSLNLDFQDRHQ